MADSSFFDKINSHVALAKLVEGLGCEIVGENADSILITDVAPLSRASAGEISFFTNPKYKEELKATKASVVILEEANIPLAPDGVALVVSNNPYATYAAVVARLYPDESAVAFIANSAVIDPTAKIGAGCYIAHGVVIEAHAEIGDDCYIGVGSYIGRGVKIGKQTKVSHNCTLTFCHIGNNCLLHPGVRIGQDGFGFANDARGLIKVKQLGRVVVGSSVEIGANTCIDRGAIDDTLIGDGTKIDNLVQIGHNVVAGRSCIFVAQVGIAGSTKIGDGVVLGGQVGISGHLNIGSGVMVSAQSGVAKDVEAKAVIGGTPAVPIRQWHRQNALLRDMAARKNNETQ